MIYPIAEGKALHELKLFLKWHKQYDYSFSYSWKITDVLASCRFRQLKLTEGKLQLYPRQLVSLARYYRFHYKENQNAPAGCSRERTKELLLEWVHVLHQTLNQDGSLPLVTEMAGEFLNPFFPVPLYDNVLPLDALLSQAEFAGAMEEPAYPSPEGLPLRQGGFAKSGTPEQNACFWLAQLWVLARNEWRLQKENADEQENADEYEMIRRFSKYRRPQAVFLFALWYAQAYHQMNKETTEVRADEMLYLRYSSSRVRNSVLEFTTGNNLSDCMKDYSDFMVHIPAEGENALAFLYTDPESLGKEPLEELELPLAEMLDSGFRVRDSNLFFYGLKIKTLKMLFSNLNEFCAEEQAEQYHSQKKASSALKEYRSCFVLTFNEKEEESLPGGCDKMTLMKEILERTVFCSPAEIPAVAKAYQKLQENPNNTEPLDDIQHTLLSCWKMKILRRYYNDFCWLRFKNRGNKDEVKPKLASQLSEEDKTSLEQIYKLLWRFYKKEQEIGKTAETILKSHHKGFSDTMRITWNHMTEISPEISVPAVLNLCNGQPLTQEQKEVLFREPNGTLRKMCTTIPQKKNLNKLEKDICTDQKQLNQKRRKNFYMLVLSFWKSCRTNNEQGKMLKDLFGDKLPEALRFAVMLDEHPEYAAAEVFARARTMLLMNYRLWVRSGIPNNPEIAWYSAEHLCIPKDLKKREKAFLKKLKNILDKRS